MAPERKVPVLRSDHNLIDQEFGSIRERFESEMRKMEDEMNRFRNQLVDRESSLFGPNSYSTQVTEKRSSHTTSSSSDSSRDRPGGGLSGGELSKYNTNWLDDLNSPLVQDTKDGKCLKLKFDVTQYAPEEIVVKTVDNRLQVHAKHEEKSDNRSVYREYNREFLLPKGTNPELIRSSLSRDGVLTVEAPVPALGDSERRIPIAHK